MADRQSVGHLQMKSSSSERRRDDGTHRRAKLTVWQTDTRTSWISHLTRRKIQTFECGRKNATVPLRLSRRTAAELSRARRNSQRLLPAPIFRFMRSKDSRETAMA